MKTYEQFKDKNIKKFLDKIEAEDKEFFAKIKDNKNKPSLKIGDIVDLEVI